MPPLQTPGESWVTHKLMHNTSDMNDLHSGTLTVGGSLPWGPKKAKDLHSGESLPWGPNYKIWYAM